MARWEVFFVAGCVLCGLGCGGSSVASNARPDAQTAGSAMAGACGDEPAPWVIDLSEDKANQLESAMKRGGLVLVRYDCSEIKIIRGCNVARGDYSYAGLSFEQKHKEIEDQDSLSLSMSAGPAFAAKMKGEFERGSIFRIDYSAIGRMTTTTEVVSRDMLVGGKKCDDATHFVGAMDLGAYVLVSGAAAEIGVAAEIFGQGTKAGSTSKVKNQSSGGEVSACKSAGADDGSPPGGCRAPLLVQLFPIDPPAGPGGSASRPPPRPPRPPGSFNIVCPPGKVVDEHGSCRSKSSGAAYVCKIGDLADCRAQCDKGNPQSCAALGYMYEKGEGTKENISAARDAYQKSCDKRDPDGCTGLGYLMSKSEDPKLIAKSTEIFRVACDKGNGRACSGLGQQARLRRDWDPAYREFSKACSRGYKRGCFYAGHILSKQGRDDAMAVSHFKRACDGGDDRGCLAAGGYLSQGIGGSASQGKVYISQGMSTLTAECKQSRYESCEVLGDFFNGRYGKVAPQGDKAIENYEKACAGGQEDACWEVGLIYEGGLGGVKRDPARAKDAFGRACSKGYDDACKKAGMRPPAAGRRAPR
jgi:uncharacterized protein